MAITAIRLPPNPKVEIEFTAGVWTDVSADVANDVTPMSMQFGRQSEFQPPQAAQFAVVLSNTDQRYTPQNQASPYWPNIQQRKRIRYSYNPGVQRFRFTGYIKAWQPLMHEGWRPVMAITAFDRMDQLARVFMLSPIRQEIALDDPLLWWPLTDAGPLASEESGNNGPDLAIANTAAAALTFGDNGPGDGDGPGVLFAAGQYLTTGGVTVDRNHTVEFWFNITAAPGGNVGMVALDQAISGTFSGGHSITLGLDSSRHVTMSLAGSLLITSSVVVAVKNWHHVALTRTNVLNVSTNYVLYVDGVNVGTASGGAISFISWRTVTVGQTDSSLASGLFAGNIGEVAVYNAALSSGRVATHAQSGTGFAGERTDQRITRFLGYAGLTGSDWNVDTGQTTVGTYPSDGNAIATGCQDIAATEGGGAAVYCTPDGKVRFANRRYRDNRTPKLTINWADLEGSGSGYNPSFDAVTLVNRATASRSGGSGVLSSQPTSNASSVAQFGPTDAQDVTTYTQSDADALNLAQYAVASQAFPGLRFPQLTIDLAACDSDLYDAVGQLQIGDRIRLNSIPANGYPRTTLDFYVEGWTETPDVASNFAVFDVTAADNPPRWKWDTSDWQPTPGSMTLNGAITAAATTIVVATSAGNPTFTTTGGSYPFDIQIGEEDIRLNSAPGGATSPQTFTGVTRGVNGTTAAAQAFAAAVTLASADTWAL